MKTQSNPSIKWLKIIGLFIGSWLAVVLLFALQLHLVSGWSVNQALRMSAPLWMIWLALAPLTVGLALKFPYGKGHNVRHALVHLISCFVMVFASQTITRKFMANRQGFIRPGGPSPWVRLQMESNQSQGAPDATMSGFRANRPFGLPVNLTAARSTFDVLIFWTLISSCQAYTWIRRAREKEHHAIAAEASARKAQLMALQSQLNPHFLFNSLNAITTLVHTDAGAADEMLTDLSGLLRTSLESKANPTISLREELQLLEHYLDIEKKRFGDRLTWHMEIDDKAHDVHVPTFILQPLIENAIRHGIERTSLSGLITLTIIRATNKLRITIRDNGPGFQPKPHQSDRTGIGLDNTRQRLDRLYGASATLKLSNPPEGGCLVALELPMDPNQTKGTPHA